MTKVILTMGMLLGLLVLTGCESADDSPRFEGNIVSHVDTYGSGTGNESRLHREGSMISGFDYNDSSKPDWTSDITWHFLRQEGGSDVYRVEWIFRSKSGTAGQKTKEVSFDGTKSVTIFSNQWQVISVEPGKDEVPASRSSGREPADSLRNKYDITGG